MTPPAASTMRAVVNECKEASRRTVTVVTSFAVAGDLAAIRRPSSHSPRLTAA